MDVAVKIVRCNYRSLSFCGTKFTGTTTDLIYTLDVGRTAHTMGMSISTGSTSKCLSPKNIIHMYHSTGESNQLAGKPVGTQQFSKSKTHGRSDGIGNHHYLWFWCKSTEKDPKSSMDGGTASMKQPTNGTW